MITARYPHCKKSGFTLLEMAIVVAVIGLIIGGIVAGHSLIRSAQLREVIGEYDRYQKAIHEFRDKYNELPGDFTKAVSYWGGDSCPTNAVSDLKRETCNGNGDGYVGSSTSAGVVSPNSEEWFRAWQHLANGGLIEGMFTGTQGSGGASETVPGSNIPASKITPGGWLLMYYHLIATDLDMWGEPSYGHILQYGGSVAGSGNRNRYAILTPTETFDMDIKIDDGKPGTGKMRSWRENVHVACTELDSSQTNAVYRTSYNQPSCAPIFILGF